MRCFMQMMALVLALAISTPNALWADDAESQAEDQSQAEESGSLVKRGVAAGVSTGGSATKNITSGLTEGIDEGRKAGESLDGALIVSNKADFAKQVGSATAIKVEDQGNGSYQVTVAIRNEQDKPLRLTNFVMPVNAMLLDSEGFAYVAKEASDVTVLPKSASRVRFNFTQVELPPATLRLYEHDIALPSAAVASGGN